MLFGLIKFKDWNKCGKVYTAAQVRQILRNAGVLGDIWLRDEEYRAINDKDFQKLKDRYCTFGDIPYMSKVYECEDFTDRMVSDINIGWAKEVTKPEALAHCGGYMDGVIVNDSGENKGHAWYWRIGDNGIPLFYQAQTGGIMTWKIVKMSDAEA